MRDTKLVITQPFEKLKQEHITFSLTTIVRLQKLGADAHSLYVHYCTTAKLQSIATGKYRNTIKATSTYSMNGLNMTSARFSKAKKLLLTNGFIEDYKPRDKKGQIIRHYIKIHYFLKNVILEEDTNETHPIENPEGGVPTMWETQNEENHDTNTKDKKGNTIDKKRNSTNEKVNNIIIASQKVSLDEKENQEETAPTDNIMIGNHNRISQEEQQAQEIIDAIKAEYSLDLKNPKKWEQQITDIAELQKELPRTTKDFVNCVQSLLKNPFYKQIHLSLVLSAIRKMPTNTKNRINEDDEEKWGTTADEFLTELFKQDAKRNGTTPEIEKQKFDEEQKVYQELKAEGKM